VFIWAYSQIIILFTNILKMIRLAVLSKEKLLKIKKKHYQFGKSGGIELVNS
jgi:hypothetical protein